MFFRFAIPLSLLFCVYADLPDVPHALPSPAANSARAMRSRQKIASRFTRRSILEIQQDQGKPAPSQPSKSDTLQESSKLSLIRYVSGEFAKARKPLPGGKDGITLYADKPLDEQSLNRAIGMHGAAVNTGDPVQITKLEFRRARHHRRRQRRRPPEEELDGSYSIRDGRHTCSHYNNDNRWPGSRSPGISARPWRNHLPAVHQEHSGPQRG